jgi:hypothetical protein
VACNQASGSLLLPGTTAVALVHNWEIIDVIGTERTFGSIGNGWDISGVVAATRDRTLWRRSTVTEGLSEWPDTAIVNNSLLSQWTVRSANDVASLGTHSHSLTCPATVLPVTCGTRGSSSVFSAAVGTAYFVRCPSDCHMRSGHVFGQGGTYNRASHVCRAGAHAGLYALDGTLRVPDPSDGVPPVAQASVTLSSTAWTAPLLSMPLDLWVLIDAETSTDFTVQRTFVLQLINALDVELDARHVRMSVYQYSASTNAISALTHDRDTLVTAVSAANKVAGVRNLALAFSTINTQMLSTGRANAAKVVLAISFGSYSSSATTNADTLKSNNAAIAIVSVAASGAQNTTNRGLATADEFVYDVSSGANLVDAIFPLRNSLWYLQACSNSPIGPTTAPVYLFVQNSASSVSTGSETQCVKSYSLSASGTTFSISVPSPVLCTNNCTAPRNGLCDRVSGRCVCMPGYSGGDCSVVSCAEICHNGGACNTATGTCNCASGFSGPSCLVRTCPSNCNSNGECDTATGLCRCHPGFFGVACAERFCPNACNGNGVCDTATGVCRCYSGFAGLDCSLRLCPLGCSGQGTCDLTTGRCTCAAGDLTAPHNGACAQGRCPNDCSGHGSCNTVARVCTCDAGWLGFDCSLPIVN